MKQKNTNKIIELTTELCKELGLDLSKPNFKDTPKRMTETYMGACKYDTKEAKQQLRESLKVTFPTKYKGMIIQEPIRVYSLCSHHLLPVTYDILFGYIVKDLSLGFSKSSKIFEILASHPVSQEDFTQEAVDLFTKALKPRGIFLVVRGLHYCMKIRSVKSDAINITSAVTGDFQKEEKSRMEFLSLAKFDVKD